MVKIYSLNKRSSNKKIEDTLENIEKSNSIILIHASWCLYCKMFKPIWKDFVKQLEKNKKNKDIVIVDIESEILPQIIEKNKKLEVHGYPSIKYTKAGSKTLCDYRGMREIGEMNNKIINKFNK